MFHIAESRMDDVNIDRIGQVIMMFYEHSKANAAIEVQDIFHRFTFDNSLEFLAGFKFVSPQLNLRNVIQYLFHRNVFYFIFLERLRRVI